MAEFITLKCPTCGAKLHFEQGTRIFTCDHCGNSHLLETSSQALSASFKLPKQAWMRVGEYQIFLHEVLEDQIDDQRVIYINIEYANQHSNGPLSCRRNQWLLFDQESYSYEPARTSTTLYEDQHRPYFGSERYLNPKMHARGWLAFIVPATAQIKRLQFFTGFVTTHSVDILLDGTGSSPSWWPNWGRRS